MLKRSNLQAVYTLAQLARMGNLIDGLGNPDTRRLAKTLEAERVPIHIRGNRRVREVYLTDLRRCVPDLLAAILEVAEDGG